MSLRVKKFGGYGNGTRGDVALNSGQINSYAPVTAIIGREVTMGTNNIGSLDNFDVGVEVLLHVSATAGSAVEKLGEYAFARIENITGSVLTLDRPLEWTIRNEDVSAYHIQIVTVPNFGKLTVNGILLAASYNATTKCGGILTLKCSKDLVFDGGRLDVSSRGIPTTASGLRPVLPNETTEAGKLFIHSELPTMNKGNGVVFVCAKRTTFDTTAIIGGAAYGDVDVGAGDGGASILFVTDEAVNFRPEAISTGGVTNGIGRGRCRIVTKPEPALRIPSYELLYGHDLIHDPAWLRYLGFKTFGDGRYKSVTNPTGQICSYAAVHRIDADLQTIETNVVRNGVYAPLEEGALVQFHVSGCKGTQVLEYGKYVVRKIIHRTTNGSNTIFTLDEPLPVHPTITNDYWCQLIGVAQFESLTLRDHTINTPVWQNNCGAILAIACNNMLNMFNSKILTVSGAFNQYLRASGIDQTNAAAAARMMLGQRNGGVLILAKNIVSDSSSRVGGIGDPSHLVGIGGPAMDQNKGWVWTGGSSLSPTEYYHGEDGGAGFGGGQGGIGDIWEYYRPHSIPGKNAIDARGAPGSVNYTSRPKAGYMGQCYLWNIPDRGRAGASIVCVSETPVTEYVAIMNSGGEGGGCGGAEGTPGEVAQTYGGQQGGGCGQLMFFHVGGEA